MWHRIQALLHINLSTPLLPTCSCRSAVALVILLFLHNFRNALIVMVVVPVSLVATFIGMSLFNFTLNLMSLLALSLVIGVLVDDAIVVIENVYRHIEMGKNRVRATFDALPNRRYRDFRYRGTGGSISAHYFYQYACVRYLRQFCAVIVSPSYSACWLRLRLCRF
jgi:HAE1 family hydrophobic/amphiphilic exporter-1